MWTGKTTVAFVFSTCTTTILSNSLSTVLDNESNVDPAAWRKTQNWTNRGNALCRRRRHGDSLFELLSFYVLYPAQRQHRRQYVRTSPQAGRTDHNNILYYDIKSYKYINLQRALYIPAHPQPRTHIYGSIVVFLVIIALILYNYLWKDERRKDDERPKIENPHFTRRYD